MKWTTNRQNLSGAVGVVQRAFSARTVFTPAIRVEATADGWLTLSATDYELTITQSVMAEVQEPGVVLLPADRLAYFAAGSRGEQVSCVLSGTTATLTGQGSKAALRTLDLDTYPPLPALEGAEGTVGGPALKAALERVTFAAGDGKDRPVLRAVEWRNQDGTITVTGSDGHRLATDVVEADVWPEGRALLLPSRACVELTRLLDEDDVTVLMGQAAAQFTSGPTVLVSQLIVGDYPEWPRLLPATFERSVTVRADVLRHDARLIQRLDVDTLLIYADPETGLLLKGTDAERGDVEAIIADAVLDGDAGRVALETRYLVDALAVFGERDVRIGLNGPSMPVGLTFADESRHRQVIMPKFTQVL